MTAQRAAVPLSHSDRWSIDASRLSDIAGNVYDGVQFTLRDAAGALVLSGVIESRSNQCTFAHAASDDNRVASAKAAFLAFLAALAPEAGR